MNSIKENKKCINDPLYSTIKIFLNDLIEKAEESGNENKIEEAKRKYGNLTSQDIMIDEPVLTSKGLLVNFVTRKNGFIRSDVIINPLTIERVLYDFGVKIKLLDNEESLIEYINNTYNKDDLPFEIVKLLDTNKLGVIIGNKELTAEDVMANMKDLFFDKYTVTDENIIIESRNITTSNFTFYKLENILVTDEKLIKEILFPNLTEPYIENIINIKIDKNVSFSNVRINGVSISEPIPINNVIENIGNAEGIADEANDFKSVVIRFIPINTNTDIEISIEILDDDGVVLDSDKKEEILEINEESIPLSFNFDRTSYPIDRTVNGKISLDLTNVDIDNSSFKMSYYKNNNTLIDSIPIFPNRDDDGTINNEYPLLCTLTISEDIFDKETNFIIKIDNQTNEDKKSLIYSSSSPDFVYIPMVEWDVLERPNSNKTYSQDNKYLLLKGVSFSESKDGVIRNPIDYKLIDVDVSKEDMSVNMTKEQIEIIPNVDDPNKCDIYINYDYKLGENATITGLLTFGIKDEPLSIMGGEFININITPSNDQFIIRDVAITANSESNKGTFTFQIYDNINKKFSNKEFDENARIKFSISRECLLEQTGSITYNTTKKEYSMPIDIIGFGDFETIMIGFKAYVGTFANPLWTVNFTYEDPEMLTNGVIFPMVAKIDNKPVGFKNSGIFTPIDKAEGVDTDDFFALHPSTGYDASKGRYVLNYSNVPIKGETYSFKGSIYIGDNKVLYPFEFDGSYAK